MKNAYLVHGWEGNPDNCWFPWLKTELEKLDYNVVIPAMPESDSPEINAWINKLQDICELNEQTIMIGHSIGCQAILRFLEKTAKKIKAVFMVAGFINLNHLETEEEQIIAKPWLTTPIDFDKIKTLAKYIAFFSDNDPDVDMDDSEIFSEKLNAKIIIEHDKGHFSDDAGVFELHSLLHEVKELETK